METSDATGVVSAPAVAGPTEVPAVTEDASVVTDEVAKATLELNTLELLPATELTTFAMLACTNSSSLEDIGAEMRPSPTLVKPAKLLEENLPAESGTLADSKPLPLTTELTPGARLVAADSGTLEDIPAEISPSPTLVKPAKL